MKKQFLVFLVFNFVVLNALATGDHPFNADPSLTQAGKAADLADSRPFVNRKAAFMAVAAANVIIYGAYLYATTNFKTINGCSGLHDEWGRQRVVW